MGNFSPEASKSFNDPEKSLNEPTLSSAEHELVLPPHGQSSADAGKRFFKATKSLSEPSKFLLFEKNRLSTYRFHRRYSTSGLFNPYNNSNNLSQSSDWNEAMMQPRLSKNVDTNESTEDTKQSYMEELTPEEIASIPLDSEGNPTSLGSLGHLSGTCKPCAFNRNPKKNGCNNGLKCPFCHFPHAKKTKPFRLSKYKRKLRKKEEEKKLLGENMSNRRLGCLEESKEGWEDENNSLIFPTFAKMIDTKAKKTSESWVNNYTRNPSMGTGQVLFNSSGNSGQVFLGNENSETESNEFSSFARKSGITSFKTNSFDYGTRVFPHVPAYFPVLDLKNNFPGKSPLSLIEEETTGGPYCSEILEFEDLFPVKRDSRNEYQTVELKEVSIRTRLSQDLKCPADFRKVRFSRPDERTNFDTEDTENTTSNMKYFNQKRNYTGIKFSKDTKKNLKIASPVMYLLQNIKSQDISLAPQQRYPGKKKINDASLSKVNNVNRRQRTGCPTFFSNYVNFGLANSHNIVESTAISKASKNITVYPGVIENHTRIPPPPPGYPPIDTFQKVKMGNVFRGRVNEMLNPHIRQFAGPFLQNYKHIKEIKDWSSMYLQYLTKK